MRPCTVRDLLEAASKLDPNMEVQLTMTVYKGRDFFVSPVTNIEVNTNDYSDDGVTRLYISGVPAGHEED